MPGLTPADNAVHCPPEAGEFLLDPLLVGPLAVTIDALHNAQANRRADVWTLRQAIRQIEQGIKQRQNPLLE